MSVPARARNAEWHSNPSKFLSAQRRRSTSARCIRDGPLRAGELPYLQQRLVSFVALPGQDEASLLRLAASLERGSEHPLAAAIIAGAAERKVELAVTENLEPLTGCGIAGTFVGRWKARFATRRAEARDPMSADSHDLRVGTFFGKKPHD